MKFEDIYQPTLHYEGSSMIAGKTDMEVTPGDDNLPWDAPLIAAFMADNDIQQIKFCSTNIGFVKTLTKRLKGEK